MVKFTQIEGSVEKHELTGVRYIHIKKEHSVYLDPKHIHLITACYADEDTVTPYSRISIGASTLTLKESPEDIVRAIQSAQ